MARPSSDIKPGPPPWSKGCVTFPLTVGNDTIVQAGLITFPKEILQFLEEGHTFTIEGSFDMRDPGLRRVTSINLSIDVFGDEDEEQTSTPTNKE